MNVLFVCTGNICRSPLAEAIARDAVARSGLEANVASAGTHAQEGHAASEYAQAVALKHGLDLSGHRARQLTPELATWADLVVAMTPEHAAQATSVGAADVMQIGPIPDPIFGELDDYHRTVQLLSDCMPDVLALIADER